MFEVEREDLEAFKVGWRRLASVPGFRGSQLSEAISGETRFQLVNVAQWDSAQAWRAAGEHPEMRAAAQRFGSVHRVCR